MSENNSGQSERKKIGEIFNRTADPLEEFNEGFREVEEKYGDPFEKFLKEEKEGNVASSTLNGYQQAFRHFREFMRSTDRHPACANTGHVVDFVQHELEVKGNETSTVKTKLQKLDIAFNYLQRSSIYPQESDYNPFANAKKKANWPDKKNEKFPNVTRSKLCNIFEQITNIRRLIIVLLGFKCGMRQGEIRNLKLQDIHIKNTDVQSYYEDLGTGPRIKEQNRENVIYIPSRHNRPGNKSKRHRLLPLDDEVRRTLLDYLLIRPDCGEPWVFVTQTDHEHITDKDRLNEIWREEVASQIDTKERHRPIRSHFGRHWFTSYWRVQDDLNRELIQYMRGDKIGESYSQNEAIDEYIHAYFEDIKEEYLSKVFKFNI